MKKIFREIHIWLSVPFGIIIALICLTGALMVFETEIKEFCSPGLYYVGNADGSTVTMEEAVQKASTNLPDGVSVTGISVSSDPKRTWKINLSKPRHAAIYFDQYSGEIIGESPKDDFWSTVRQLHRWLLLQNVPAGEISLGKTVIGGSTIAFVFVLLSGLFTWWPRTIKGLKNSLKPITGKGRWRFWHSLHIAGGAYALLPLLVMALTGLTWSFQWYSNGFYSLFGADAMAQAKVTDKTNGNATDSASPYAVWSKVYAEVASKYDRYNQITVSAGKATVSLSGAGNQRASDTYTFDTHNGDITSTRPYSESNRRQKISGWIYSLHVGSWGGIITKIVALLAALLGATLAITGYYMWIRRKFITKSK